MRTICMCRFVHIYFVELMCILDSNYLTFEEKDLPPDISHSVKASLTALLE